MNESYSLDDLEQLELEQSVQIANKDTITVCKCNSMCLKTMGKTRVLVRQPDNIAQLKSFTSRQFHEMKQENNSE